MNISRRYQTILFTFLTGILSLLFITQALQSADKKDFWTDEDMALNITLTRGYTATLLQGAKTQGSPAPLEYLALKLLKQIKSSVHSFGVSFNTYYRLNSIFYTFLSGLIVMGLAFFKLNSLKFKNINERQSNQSIYIYLFQTICLLSALSLYYFMPNNFHFSIEMRPYALWNSLWVVSTVLFMFYEKHKKLLVLSLTLLAMTATAAIFQLFAFAVSFVVIKLLHKEKIADVFKSSIEIFIIPTIVCLYYILGATQTWNYGNADRYWEEFLYFWMTSERILLFSLLGVTLASASKKFQSHMVIFSTMGILYLMSPAINYITILKGFFFSPRQYRYYELIYPLFLISGSEVIPYYFKKENWSKSVCSFIRGGLIIFLCSWIGYSFYDDYGIDRIKKMNQLMPISYEHLIEISKHPEKVDTTKIKTYHKYYQTLAKYLPHRSDVYGMLGFCYYHMNQDKKAVSMYKKASARNPEFFWYYYNVGVISYKEGQYEEAVQSFEKALNIDYKETFKTIFLSQRIYQPILENLKENRKQWLEQQALQGYRNCYRLLAESYRYMGENKKAEVMSIKSRVLTVNKNLLEIESKDIGLEVY